VALAPLAEDFRLDSGLLGAIAGSDDVIGAFAARFRDDLVKRLIDVVQRYLVVSSIPRRQRAVPDELLKRDARNLAIIVNATWRR
jgi:hypothetical protein